MRALRSWAGANRLLLQRTGDKHIRTVVARGDHTRNQRQHDNHLYYDVVIVGCGPSGLSTAIKLKQLSKQYQKDISVCILEKSKSIGAHILSGNVFINDALAELLPEWHDMAPPIQTMVTRDYYMYLREKAGYTIPPIFLPQMTQNKGNYIVALSDVCKWLGEVAESLGVEIYPGFSVNGYICESATKNVVDDGSSAIIGVTTSEMGLSKTNHKKANYEPSMNLIGKQIVVAEGCRGSLSEEIMKDFNLSKDASPQAYGLGLKEVWEFNDNKLEKGTVVHTVGWPLDNSTYGGGFIYHINANTLHLGLVVGLSYTNPFLSPYMEFQRWKTHPYINTLLKGGRCVSYGARCLNEGGLQAIPKLTFPGGMLIGCSAGFLNPAKLKGAHLAMKSGIIAAESIFNFLNQKSENKYGMELDDYGRRIMSSSIYKELKQARNVHPYFKHFGRLGGMALSGASMHLRGAEPWTMRWKKRDWEYTRPLNEVKPIEYPKPNGLTSFHLLENLQRSGTHHEHDQPTHLKIKADLAHIPNHTSYPVYGGPESYFCPAKVYEYLPDASTMVFKLNINAQNCVHCKCCSIKTPYEYIEWTVPGGGGGPAYSGM